MGDQAILASCADEASATRLAAAVRGASLPWLLDLVQAYASVAVFFDPDQIQYGAVNEAVRALFISAGRGPADVQGALHIIPCCYELALDLGRVAQATGLREWEIVELHSGAEYTVYAIGFCPGFPYLGYLPGALTGVPRLESPRLRVEAGSVGLTGRQTGIYTEPRPGGWNIVGRTPLELVNVRDGYFPLRTGDRVKFQPIDRWTFDKLSGKRLATGEASSENDLRR